MLILCLKIFFARILDVSLGTTRVILTVKGKKLFAAMCGFFEVVIWFSIVREALSTDSASIWIVISYAAGFASGTYIGGLLSDKFIKGTLSLQVVLSDKNDVVVDKIRSEGFATTILHAKGREDDSKYLLFIEINKKNLSKLKKLIQQLDPKAFIVVNETKTVTNGFIK